MSANSTTEIVSPNVIWGAQAIGEILGLSDWQTWRRLNKGQIPSARKIGSIWVASKREIERLSESESS
jgi:predicted DNA-binding transcriptional regulator AlpA